MAGLLDSFVNNMVNIMTNDGRIFVGKLKGFDQNVNVILVETQERLFSATSGVEMEPLGLYIVRGDNMYVSAYVAASAYVCACAAIGEIDEAMDAELDFENIKAEALKAVVH